MQNLRNRLSRLICPEIHRLAESQARAISRLEQDNRDLNEEIAILKDDIGKLYERLNMEGEARPLVVPSDELQELQEQKSEILKKLRAWRQSFWSEQKKSNKLTEELNNKQVKIDEQAKALEDLQADCEALKAENEGLRMAGVILRNNILYRDQEITKMRQDIPLI